MALSLYRIQGFLYSSGKKWQYSCRASNYLRLTMRACPCGKIAAKRALPYERCCGRYVEDFDLTPAPDAESLMRSRYTAYVLERVPYLLATWHPDTRPQSLDDLAPVKWLGLNIKSIVPPEPADPNTAWVEFVARSRVNGRGERLHERSRFVKQEGRWFYIDGKIFD